MSLNVIELNDTGLRVTRDGVVVCVSPGIALVDGRDDALGHPRAQRVHRRVVDGDDADAVFDVEAHQLFVVHVHFLW